MSTNLRWPWTAEEGESKLWPLLPGLNVLYGRPKTFKTWTALKLVHHAVFVGGEATAAVLCPSMHRNTLLRRLALLITDIDVECYNTGRVTDDQSMLVDTVVKLLASKGSSVRVFTHKEQLEKALGEQPFDVVVLDEVPYPTDVDLVLTACPGAITLVVGQHLDPSLKAQAQTVTYIAPHLRLGGHFVFTSEKHPYDPEGPIGSQAEVRIQPPRFLEILPP